MTSATPLSADVVEMVDELGPPGTPVTTPEVTEGFDCTQRTIYNRLESLVEDGVLQTKKVGANSRVWWRPVETDTQQRGTTWERRIRSHPVFESEMVGVIVWERDAISGDSTDLVLKDANEAFLEIAGFEYEAALETSWRDLTPEEFYEVSEQHIEEVNATGSGVAYEKQYYHVDGSRWWGLFESRKPDDDTYVEFVVDITERKQMETDLRESEAALERLNAATRELLDSESETIADRVPGLVREVLDVEYAALWRYDDQRGDIEEYVIDTAPAVDLGAASLSTEISGPVWQTFVGSDVDVATDPDSDEDTWGPLESHVLVPLGRHGVVCLGSTRGDTFDERTVDLVETVAATVETAWNRAEGERELERQNEKLTRLDRLNTLIREIDQALVAADTREAIVEAVCERLADSALYGFAWIGVYDAETRTVIPRAWAGVDSAYLDTLRTDKRDTVTNGSPFSAAIRTGELQVVADVATDARAAPWREETLERGGRSCLCIPLAYDESVYGVLTVYGDTPHQETRDTEVLAELGRTIAHAIYAIETRDSVRTDTVYELTLESTAAATPLCRLSRTTDCVIDFEGQITGSDGHTTVFFTTSGVDPDEFGAACERSVAVDDLVRLDERDDSVFYKARLADSTFAGTLLEEGTTVRSLAIDSGSVTAVVDLPETAEVSTAVTAIRRSVPDVELLARQTRTRSPDTERTLQTTLEERLTPRQQEVLQLAYRSGFFESPRSADRQATRRGTGPLPVDVQLSPPWGRAHALRVRVRLFLSPSRSPAALSSTGTNGGRLV